MKGGRVGDGYTLLPGVDLAGGALISAVETNSGSLMKINSDDELVKYFRTSLFFI